MPACCVQLLVSPELAVVPLNLVDAQLASKFEVNLRGVQLSWSPLYGLIKAQV